MVRDRAEKLVFGVAQAVIAFLLIETIRRGLPIPDVGRILPGPLEIPGELVIPLGVLVVDERFVLFFALMAAFIIVLSDEEVYDQFNDEVPDSEVEKLIDKALYGIGSIIVFGALFVPVSLVLSVLAGFVGVEIPAADALFWLTALVIIWLIYDSRSYFGSEVRPNADEFDDPVE